MEFMSEYKYLEKLCSEIMMVNHGGVTAYIDKMVSTPDGERLVPGWRDDLNALKRYRGIRNQIAHDPNFDEEDLCEPGDEEWLTKFHDRIISGEDPLANYRRRADAIRAANAAASRRAAASAASRVTTPPASFATHAPNYAAQTYAARNYAAQNFAAQNFTAQNNAAQTYAARNYATNPHFANPPSNGNYRQPSKRRSRSRRKVLHVLLILLLIPLLLFGLGIAFTYLPQIMQNLSSVLSNLRSH